MDCDEGRDSWWEIQRWAQTLKSPKTYMGKLEIMYGSCVMFEVKSCPAQNQEIIDFEMEI